MFGNLNYEILKNAKFQKDGDREEIQPQNVIGINGVQTTRGGLGQV